MESMNMINFQFKSWKVTKHIEEEVDQEIVKKVDELQDRLN